MKLIRNLVIVILALVGLTLSITGTGIAKGVLAYYGWPFKVENIAEINARLEPYDTWFWPEAATMQGIQFPAVLMVPGCLGTQPFHIDWANWFTSNGMAVLLIDSFASRGVSDIDALETVCEGKHIWGFERAGDILVSLERLRTHERIAPDRLNLIGWSHGGWAVMDAVSLAHANTPPPFIKTLPRDALSGINSVTTLYPYCGFGNYIHEHGWPNEIDGLIILASESRNIDPDECREAAAVSAIDIMELKTGHWFDNPSRHAVIDNVYDDNSTQRAKATVLRRLQ